MDMDMENLTCFTESVGAYEGSRPHMHMDKCISEDTRLTHSIHMAPKYLSYVKGWEVSCDNSLLLSLLGVNLLDISIVLWIFV